MDKRKKKFWGLQKRRSSVDEESSTVTGADDRGAFKAESSSSSSCTCCRLRRSHSFPFANFDPKEYFKTSRARLPEEAMDAQGIIDYHGFLCQEFDVMTSDGYVLKLHRIPPSASGEGDGSLDKNPVLLVHGLAASSTSFITNTEKNCLGFMLAKAGFDVWLGNVRGNVYSQRHATLSVDDDEFWNFSWDEMALYDLPSMVDFILKETAKPNISYVGYSQGALLGFAAFSTYRELNTKVSVFVAMAPAVTLAYIKSPIRHMKPLIKVLDKTLRKFGDVYHGDVTRMSKYIQPLCDYEQIDHLCQNMIFYLVGPGSGRYIDEERVHVYLAQNPAGTSIKNLIHYGQMIKRKVVRRFDYGLFKNAQVYGQREAPEYRLENVSVPVLVIWSLIDLYADSKDIEQLLLPRLKVPVQTLKIDDYSHLDFLWADNVGERVYCKILDVLNEQG